MHPADDEDGKSSPRVPFGREESAAKADPTSTPRVPFGTPLPPRAPVVGPRIVGEGVVRHRIPCSEAELRKIDPEASDDILSSAVRVVASINLDDHEFDDVVRFGASLQRRHGELADAELALAADERLAAAKEMSADLLHHLYAVEPDRLFLPRQRFLSGLREAISPRSAAEAFQDHAVRIRTIARSIAGRADDFADLGEALQGLKSRWRNLMEALQAHLLAGQFIVGHIAAAVSRDPRTATHYETQKDALEGRLASLAATLSSLALGARTLSALESTIVDARAFAGDAVERDLPAWLTACSAALAARSHQASRDTSEVRRLYSKILNTVQRKDPE